MKLVRFLYIVLRRLAKCLLPITESIILMFCLVDVGCSTQFASEGLCNLMSKCL